MADVEAFDPLHRRGQAQRFLQRRQALVLGRLLRQLLADGKPRILDGHRHPHAPLAARVGDQVHFPARLRQQHLGEHFVVDTFGDDRRRRRPVQVVLHQERPYDLDQRRGFGMLRKQGSVADVAPAANHHHVDRSQALLYRCGDDIDVAGRRAFDELARLQLLQAGDLVANPCCALECQRRRRLGHLPLQVFEHLVRLALQEQRRVLHVLLIVGLADKPYAGAGAALNLVEHAWPRTIGKHAGLAGAQLKHLLQHADALAHRARTGKRPEVRVRFLQLTAMEAQLREAFAGQAQVRIALVIAEDDVVARLVRLDQVVLQQQRLGFRTRHRRLDPRHLRDHQRGARRVAGLLEIAGDALLQVARLAHIECLAGGTEHAIDARAAGQ